MHNLNKYKNNKVNKQYTGQEETDTPMGLSEAFSKIMLIYHKILENVIEIQNYVIWILFDALGESTGC